MEEILLYHLIVHHVALIVHHCFSSTGIHHVEFSVSVPPHCSEHVDLEYEEKFSWSDESFCTHDAQFPESVLVNLFHLERTKIDETVVDYQCNITTINKEIAHCRELLSTMNCKIGKLTLPRLLMAHDTLMLYAGTCHRNVSYHAEILQLCDDLKKMNPAHLHYYQDEYSIVLLKQVFGISVNTKMANNQSIKSVSCCYVFKSRLQEYTQKVGLPTPVYETIKEGPAHEPTFMSTVIVDNVRYDSLPGFYNRKAAEQSAAEVALMRLGNAGSMQNLSQPVHETGLCKNLLQDYAQKMNFAIPQYECQRYDTESKMITFSCTVDVGGMKYIGAAARTKKEAEIKAARTALLAVQSSGLGPNNSGYTVVPMKKVTDLAISNQESAAALKPKKSKFKKKQKRNTGESQVQMVNQAKPELHENAVVGTQGTDSGPAPVVATMGDLVPSNNWSSDYRTSNLGIYSVWWRREMSLLELGR